MNPKPKKISVPKGYILTLPEFERQAMLRAARARAVKNLKLKPLKQSTVKSLYRILFASRTIGMMGIATTSTALNLSRFVKAELAAERKHPTRVSTQYGKVKEQAFAHLEKMANLAEKTALNAKTTDKSLLQSPGVETMARNADFILRGKKSSKEPLIRMNPLFFLQTESFALERIRQQLNPKQIKYMDAQMAASVKRLNEQAKSN